VASSAGLGLAPYDSPEYAAAKAALIRFTSTLAGLQKTAGVRVNCVVPGWIGLDRAHRERAAMTPQQRAAAGPLVDPNELTNTILWLALDETLAGRVAIAYGNAPAQLLPAEEWRPG
jgi:NAD(P)-dependent dehydrogenase (short-subunit alcohol dehydrogenase family)